jgi:multisubunit Na+/H+ antiporter MnhF subunit
MNVWLIAATVLLLAFIPCGITIFKEPPLKGVVAYELAGVDAVLILALLAEGLHRSPFFELAFVLAFLAFGSAMVFLRFFERWV